MKVRTQLPTRHLRATANRAVPEASKVILNHILASNVKKAMEKCPTSMKIRVQDYYYSENLLRISRENPLQIH
jgi:hypothetical protein